MNKSQDISCNCSDSFTVRPFKWLDEWELKPTIGKSIVVLKNRNKFWLVQNAGNKWGPVGGGIEVGESPLDAALRECYEETGLMLKKHQLKFMYKTRQEKPTHWFNATLKDHQVPHLTSESVNEISGCGWFCNTCKSNYNLNWNGNKVFSLNMT